MRKGIRTYRWALCTVFGVFLVTVFWVWPAWNSPPSPHFGLGSCWNINLNAYKMHTNSPAPPSCQDPLSIPHPADPNVAYFWAADLEAQQGVTYPSGVFQADLDMGTTSMMTNIINYLASVGQFDSSGMFTPHASGSGDFSVSSPGGTVQISIPSSTQFNIPTGNRLGFSGQFRTSDPNAITSLDLGGHTCTLYTPLSDPPYPGELDRVAESVPTLSELGMLIMAILIAVVSVWILKRRIEIGG